MSLDAETAFIEDLILRPLAIIFMHGSIAVNTNVKNNVTNAIKTTKVPDGMLVNQITIPGEEAIVNPEIVNFISSRATFRLKSFVPLFAIHSISDLYGQKRLFWDLHTTPYNLKNGETKPQRVYKYKEGMLIKEFTGKSGETHFAFPHRAKGGATVVDMNFDAQGDPNLGIYYMLGKQTGRFTPNKSMLLSQIFKTLADNSLVFIISCSSFYDSSISSKKIQFEPHILTKTISGPITIRTMLRQAEDIAAQNEVEYHSLPLITKSSPSFELLLKYCSPILLPWLGNYWKGKANMHNQNTTVGKLQSIAKQNWNNSVNGYINEGRWLLTSIRKIKNTLRKNAAARGAAAGGASGGRRNRFTRKRRV